MPRLLLVRTLNLPLMACLLLPAMSFAQEQPIIAVVDLAQYQFAQNYVRQLVIKETEKANARAAATPNASKAIPAAQENIPPIELPITNGELHRFAIDIKGTLLTSGLYRLLPGKIWQSTNQETIPDIMHRIAQGFYPDIDYVLFGTINYVNTTMTSVAADDKQIVHTLSMEVVGEFSLINTRTGTIDAAFSSIGQGTDIHIAKLAGTVIAINKSKILRDTSLSLASSVATELAYQLTPKKIKAGTTPVTNAPNASTTHTITLK